MTTNRNIFAQYKGLSLSVYVIFAARLITKMGSFIWPMLALILTVKMGYSMSMAAGILILISLVYLPANAIGGKLADRFDRRKLIISLDIVSVIFFITCAFLPMGMPLVICFTIAGFFAAMENPAFEALIIDVTLPAEREQAYSMIYLGSNLGLVAGPAIGGLLFTNYLSVAFIIDGITTLLTTLMIILFVKIIDTSTLDRNEKNEYEDHIDDDIGTWDIIKDRRSILWHLVALFMIAFVYDQWTFALPVYMDQVFDNGPSLFGFLSSINAAAVIFLTPIITLWSKKLTELPKMLIGVLFFSGSYLLIIGIPFFPIFVVFILLFTVGEVFNMLGNSPFVSRRIPASHRGRVNGVVYNCFFIGSMMGRAIVGFVAEHYSFNVAFIMLTTVGFVSLLMINYNISVDRRSFPKLYKRSDSMTEIEEAE